MNQDPAKQAILEELKKVTFPGYSRDIVSFGFVKEILFEDGHVKIGLQLASAKPEVPHQIEQEVKQIIGQMPGVNHVEVEILLSQAASAFKGHEAHKNAELLKKVRHIIAVASGKGGVGKSTVAVNLACALKKQGYSVGLMDADVYGPSIPMMLGAAQKNPYMENGKIVPIEAHGLKLMSLGFMMQENAPAIWRGPIVTRVIQQFLHDVAWGELDVLVIDLPPGTGDVQLTLVQSITLSGALIVTTPQAIALLDVSRANEMFKTVKTPILGIVENMSTYVCPHCSHEEPIFHKGGGKIEAERIGVPLLAQIPLEPALCRAGDKGLPMVLLPEPSKAKEAFLALAQQLTDLFQSKETTAVKSI